MKKSAASADRKEGFVKNASRHANFRHTAWLLVTIEKGGTLELAGGIEEFKEI